VWQNNSNWVGSRQLTEAPISVKHSLPCVAMDSVCFSHDIYVARKIFYHLNRPTEFDSKGSHQIMGGCGQENCAADWIVGPKRLTERFLSATWIFCRDVLIVSIIVRI
jgi:hypothetical protein